LGTEIVGGCRHRSLHPALSRSGHRYLAEVDPRRRASIVVDNNDLARPRLVRPEP
jgi:hypothetical protein